MARPTKYLEHRTLVLGMVHAALAGHGAPPTVRTMADELSVGVATMHSYLTKLAEEGLIQWRPKSHRSLRLTPAGLTLAQQGSPSSSSPAGPQA